MDVVASVVNDNNGERWIKHYRSSHKILLVGDGDFSFSVCLANAFGSASNMVATSLDSREMLVSKYSKAVNNLKKLEEMGCTIIHEVDAKAMDTHHLLSRRCFDRIVFNFPHAGFVWPESTILQIQIHQAVVRDFFRSARSMLTLNGETHVTHKTTYPFSKWGIKELAKNVGLHLVEEAPFRICDYPCYENKRGDSHRSDETFPVGECSTFKFVSIMFPFSL